uniref:Uncharacterized protein LOC113791991 n=1 Tax=Dermatophagoides pteronyssinus TaxID=6956 RepID=A0A6P6XX33_DERPT|nr:uncharacterized protein LOC113791991 [Dermatophagoides pteronyssinus]
MAYLSYNSIILFFVSVFLFIINDVNGHKWKRGGYGNIVSTSYLNDCDGGCYGAHSTGIDSGYSSTNYHHSSSSQTYSTEKKISNHVIETKPVISVPATIVRKTYAVQPTVVKKTYYTQPTHSYYRQDTGCDINPCGGGSQIIKIIKKTRTYTGDNGCGYDDCNNYNNGYINTGYVQPVVVKKVTRIITQPQTVKVVKVIDDGIVGHSGGGGYSGTGSAWNGNSGGGGINRGNYQTDCKYDCNKWRK